MNAILFPLGVRLSTWLALLAFMLIAAWRSERQPVLAGIAWLAGFEGAYQVAAMLIHTPSSVPFIGPVSISLIVGMPLIAAAATMLGARPDRRLLMSAVLVFGLWLATGFHVNADATSMNPLGEVCNEASKTLWALAYLVPLALRRTAIADA